MSTDVRLGKIERLFHTDDLDCDHCSARAVIKVATKKVGSSVHYIYLCKEHKEYADEFTSTAE